MIVSATTLVVSVTGVPVGACGHLLPSAGPDFHLDMTCFPLRPFPEFSSASRLPQGDHHNTLGASFPGENQFVPLPSILLKGGLGVLGSQICGCQLPCCHFLMPALCLYPQLLLLWSTVQQVQQSALVLPVCRVPCLLWRKLQSGRHELLLISASSWVGAQSLYGRCIPVPTLINA